MTDEYDKDPPIPAPDVLWLQYDEDYGFDIETTHCQDRIGDDDVKYLKATPVRELSHDLLEQLKLCIEEIEYWHDPVANSVVKKYDIKAARELVIKIESPNG